MNNRMDGRRVAHPRRLGRRQQAPWDHKHLRLWGGLLVLLLLTPVVSIGGHTIWTWDTVEAKSALGYGNRGAGAWNQDSASWTDVLRDFFPHLYGGLALALMFLGGRHARLRGQVLAVVGVGYVVLNITGARLGETLPVQDLEVAGWSLVCGILVGPPLLAAGNRVQRREGVTGLPLWLAVLGGLMVVIPFFNQINGYTMFEIFVEPKAWESVPLIVLLLFSWASVGLVGVLLAIPGSRRVRGAVISRLLRICLWAAPLVVIGTILGELGEFMGEHAMALGWSLLRSYALMVGMLVLVAVGLARVLETPELDQEAQLEGAVEAF